MPRVLTGRRTGAATIELRVDATAAAGLGEPAAIVVAVDLPGPQTLSEQPVICFAKPGGFTRQYFTDELPGPARGAQARWRAPHGWVFVSVDHLGIGASAIHEMTRLDYPTPAAAADDAERKCCGCCRRRSRALTRR